MAEKGMFAIINLKLRIALIKDDSMQTVQTELASRIESLEFENNVLKQRIAVYIKKNARLQYKQEHTLKRIRQLIKQMKGVA